jgi:hypothetical protein
MMMTISTQCLLFIIDEELKQELQKLYPSSNQHLQLSFSILFWIMVLSLGIVIPTWKLHLAQYKVLFRGPWDIPTREVMELDYKLQI